MEKQVLAIVVVFLFCLVYTVAIVAQDRSETSSEQNGVATKAEVHKLGFGKRVDVRLKNGNRATGRITGMAPDHFVITNSKGTASAIAYAEVFQVSPQKEKLGVFDRPWKGIMFTAAGVGQLVVLTMELFN